MTAQTLHDALTLLPADLIAEADKVRNAPKKIIPWKSMAAFAACFALVLCSGWFCLTHLPGGSKLTAAEEAAAEAPMMQAPESISGMGTAPAEPESPAASAEPQEKLCSVPTAPRAESDAAASANTGCTTSLPEGILGTVSVCTPRDKASTACFESSPRVTLLKSRSELESYLEAYDWQYRWEEFTLLCEGYSESWFEEHDLLVLAVHHLPEGSCSVSSVTEQNEILHICIGTNQADNPGHTDWHIAVETKKDHIPGEDAVRLIFE